MSSTPPTSQPSGTDPKPLQPPRVPDHELLRRIGRGAYGEVWIARSATSAFRAVKIVHRRSFDHERPFEREFEGILKFEPVSRTHDSQVDILHVGRGDDCFYYVMELADDQATGGQINPDNYTPRTLKSDVQFRGRIEFEECVRIGVALTTALEHLHENGLVHRDVKPSNIIFVNGVPKLADIGLVTGVDATRSFVGTEGFAAPEGAGTPQADLYSLGKVLYEAATGKDRQEFPELPTLLRELPDRDGLMELNAVIARACRHDPKDRYVSATAMRADLELLQSGKSLARLHRTEKRLRFVQRAGAALTVLAGLIALGWLWQARQTHLVRELGNQKAKLAEEKSQLAQESRQRLIQIQTANGLRAMDENDSATAALWFAEVLDQAKGDTDLERRQRFRLGTLFRHVSKPAGFLPLELTPHWARVIDGEQRILAVGGTSGSGRQPREVKIWEASSGQLVSSVMLSNIFGYRPSPSGRWCLVSSPEGNRLYKTLDMARVVIQLPFSGHGEQSTFAEDESKLAITAFKGKDLKIVEIPSGRLLSPTLPHTNEITCLRFDLNGRQLLTGTTIPGDSGKSNPSGRARVWDANTGEPVTDWLDFEDPVTFASFSPDGRALAVLGGREVSTGSALKQNVVHVLDLPSARPRFPSLAHKDTILGAAFSPDGRCLATASADQSVMVWNAFSGEAIHPPLPHDGLVAELRFSPDGRWLAAVERKQARIWDVRSGTLVTAPLKIGAQIVRIEFTPDGSRLVVTPSSGPICVWNLSDVQPALAPFWSPDGRPITFAMFSRDGKRLVTMEDSGTLQMWDAGSGHPLGRRMESGREAFQPLEGQATWSADGRWIAVPRGDSTVRIWDALTGEPRPIILRHSQHIVSVEFSPITNHLLTASLDHTARVWDAVTGQPVTPPLQHSNGVNVARFSPDGRRIATASDDRTARVWDAATGQPVTPQLSSRKEVGALAFSPDGSRLATATEADDEATIWDATTGQQVVGPLRHLSTVTSLCFSPDGQYLLTGSMDHTARVWDARTSQPVTSPMEHAGYVVACAFNRDGDKILTASHDGTARVWDAFSGQPLSASFRHQKPVLHADFSPDGQTVVTVSLDGTAQLWEIPTLDWPVEEVEALAQVLAGASVKPSGRVEPLNPSQLETAWRKISARLPSNCLATDPEAIRWHRVSLAMSEQARKWFAAEFHSKRLLALMPDDREVQESRTRVLAHMPPPRDPATPLELIDLSGFYNASLAVPWHEGPEGNHLAEVPCGVQVFADTRFDVRGLVQVLGKPYPGGNYRYPKQVIGIPINRKLRRLQILHSIQGLQPTDGTRVGHYLVHYASGRREEIPIIYGQDARDWHEHPDAPAVGVTDAVIAWKGNNPAAKLAGTRGIRLFKRTWENPAPDMEVASVDFVAEHGEAHPFLVALTAE